MQVNAKAPSANSSKDGLHKAFGERVISTSMKAIPVTGCETSRLPHFLDNLLTDGGKFLSLMRRPPFTPRKIPGTHFC
jgi:hypothetical protein